MLTPSRLSFGIAASPIFPSLPQLSAICRRLGNAEVVAAPRVRTFHRHARDKFAAMHKAGLPKFYSLRPILSTTIRRSFAPADFFSRRTPSLRGAKRRGNPILHAGAIDCFAEPVIGLAFARPVGSQ